MPGRECLSYTRAGNVTQTGEDDDDGEPKDAIDQAPEVRITASATTDVLCTVKAKVQIAEKGKWGEPRVGTLTLRRDTTTQRSWMQLASESVRAAISTARWCQQHVAHRVRPPSAPSQTVAGACWTGATERQSVSGLARDGASVQSTAHCSAGPLTRAPLFELTQGMILLYAACLPQKGKFTWADNGKMVTVGTALQRYTYAPGTEPTGDDGKAVANTATVQVRHLLRWHTAQSGVFVSSVARSTFGGSLSARGV